MFDMLRAQKLKAIRIFILFLCFFLVPRCFQ